MPERRPAGGRAGARPAQRRRSRYYHASIVAGAVFIVIAAVFPIWWDAVRHGRDAGTTEGDTDQTPEAAPAPPAPPSGGPDRRPGAWVQAGVNAGCRAYVYARCNALDIPAAGCAPVIEAAARVPPGASMAECRKAVEGDLAAAASVYGRHEEPPAEGPATATALAGTGPDAAATPVSSPAADVPTASLAASEVASPGAAGPSPVERAERLDRLEELVRDVQRSRTARDYVLSPAAEQARLEEIRRIAEWDGSPEVRALYESLRRTGEAPLVAPSSLPSVGYASGDAPSTTPEIEAAARITAAARKEAGLAPRPAPAPVSDPSRSMSPSEVPAGSIPLAP